MMYMDTIKKGLLMDICEYYYCTVRITYANDCVFEFDNGEDYWESPSIDWALYSWLDTMIDTDNENVEEGYNPIWTEQIKFIEMNVLPNIRKNN